jgi:hypothetical protein
MERGLGSLSESSYRTKKKKPRQLLRHAGCGALIVLLTSKKSIKNIATLYPYRNGVAKIKS